jgi:uncharacterized repeat protein (TIGR01451 family)
MRRGVSPSSRLSQSARGAARSTFRALAGSRLALVALALVALSLLAQSASAQTVLYHIRGNATAGSNDIWVLNPTTGAETVVYTGYPGGNAATLAQRPSDGMLFYAINNGTGINGAVYSFNPATPNVAPALLGNIGPSTGGVNVSSGFRMAFSTGGTLYYLVGTGGAADPNTLYTVNTSTGQATKVTTITGAGDGGDMAFSPGGTLYIVDQNRNLYTASVAGGAATLVGTITFAGGVTPNTIGIAFDSTGKMLLQTVSAGAGGQLWSVTGTAASLVGAISGGGTATGDMASTAAPQPSLSITKTDGVTTVYRGGSVSYTVVVTNSSAFAVTGTVTDNVPASVTGVTWTCAASAGSSCAAASGSGNAISTTATLAVSGTATYTISGTISAAAAGTLTNTAAVAPPAWLTDSNPANNTATDTDTINLNANLGITKTDGAATVNPGANVTYTIVVSNAGPDVANGVVVTDTVPAALSSVTWTCGTPVGGATCGAASGGGNAISTTANLPSGGSVTYTVTGTLAANATGTLANTAAVAAPSGVTDPTPGNNSATDTDPINLVADPSITKTHVGNFTRGTTGSYTITVSNSGTGATSGTVTVTDTLPAGLTPQPFTNPVNGWTCGIAGQVVTCTRANVLNAGSSYPTIPVNVTVLQTAANIVTNTATVSGGGGNISTANDSASDQTTVVSSADLSLTKTASNGTPTVNTNVVFTLTLSNAGPSNASGVTVTDALPAGLSFVSATPSAGTSYNSATGLWTIGAVVSGANATLQITAKVTASGAITNTAQVTAANEPDPDSTPNNNAAAEDDQASASLNVAAPPAITLCKTFPGQTCAPAPSLPAQQPGADITYVIIFTNSGGSAAQGLTINDGVPANTDFKVGSVVTNLGTTGLTVAVAYSNNNGTTYAYTPVSGGGGAVAGYDRNVTNVRWTFTGNLLQTSPANTGDVRFTTRIR